MTLMLGGALRRTTDKLRDKLTVIAAHLLEADPADIEVAGDTYRIAGDPDQSVSLRQLARTAYRATASLPPGIEPGLVEDTVNSGPPRPRNTIEAFPSYAFDFHLVMVEVDPETFEIEFNRYLVVHDCGTVINPLVVDGFVYGGLAHGIGGALYENFSYDDSGALQAATFMDYLIPTAAEMPCVELVTMQTPTPLHPYGAKGTAEGSYMTAPAAVASAIEDALAPLGIFVDELPVTPALVFDRIARASQPEANQQDKRKERPGAPDRQRNEALPGPGPARRAAGRRPRRVADRRPRRVLHAARPERLWQDDLAAQRGRPRAAQRRRDLDS
jgi:CO/xanthine dehydrogenase Mo-binding subunit